MKSTVEQLSPTRVRINVEVPFDELKPNFDRVYRKLAQQIRVPGFRPGKAPAKVLETRIGRGAVIDEVVNEALPAKYSEAVTAGEVRPLGRPDIEVTKLDDGQLLAFTAEVDVRPDFELPDAADLSVTVDQVEIAQEEIDEQLDLLRERFGTLVGVDRTAADGDYVVMDLAATIDGKPIPEAQTTGFSYKIGSGGLIDGLDEAIIGLSADESATFNSTLVAGEYADQEAAVTVTVTAVKEREMPEADDEFAQLASEFDTLEELTDDLRNRLSRAKRMLQAAQARDRVLEALVEAVDAPLPPAVVDDEIEARTHDALHSFDHDQKAFDAWLTEQGKSRKDFDDESREAAEHSVKSQMVLDAVADTENVRLTDQELTERVIAQAQRAGVPPEQFIAQAQSDGQLGTIYADARRTKALFKVLRAASVVDSAGETVDLTDVVGPEQETEDEAVDAAEDRTAEVAEDQEREPAVGASETDRS